MATYTGPVPAFDSNNSELRRVAAIAMVQPGLLAAALYIPLEVMRGAMQAAYTGPVDYMTLSAAQLVNVAYWCMVRGASHGAISVSGLDMIHTGPAS